LEAIFSDSCLLAVLGGGRPLSLLVGSLALSPFCAQPRRFRAATEPDLLGQESLSESGIRLVSTALGFIHLKSCAATEAWTTDMLYNAVRTAAEEHTIPKAYCNEIVKSGRPEQVSSQCQCAQRCYTASSADWELSASSRSLQREKASSWVSRLSYRTF